MLTHFNLTWHIAGGHNQARYCSTGTHPWLTDAEELIAKVFSAAKQASSHAYKVTARSYRIRRKLQGGIILEIPEYHSLVREIWIGRSAVMSYIMTQDEPVRKLGYSLKIYRPEAIRLRVRDEFAEHYGLDPESLDAEICKPLHL